MSHYHQHSEDGPVFGPTILMAHTGTKVTKRKCAGCGTLIPCDIPIGHPDYPKTHVDVVFQLEEPNGGPTLTWVDDAHHEKPPSEAAPPPIPARRAEPAMESRALPFFSRLRHHAETAAIAITVIGGVLAIAGYAVENQATILPMITHVWGTVVTILPVFAKVFSILILR